MISASSSAKILPNVFERYLSNITAVKMGMMARQVSIIGRYDIFGDAKSQMHDMGIMHISAIKVKTKSVFRCHNFNLKITVTVPIAKAAVNKIFKIKYNVGACPLLWSISAKKTFLKQPKTASMILRGEIADIPIADISK